MLFYTTILVKKSTYTRRKRKRVHGLHGLARREEEEVHGLHGLTRREEEEVHGLHGLARREEEERSHLTEARRDGAHGGRGSGSRITRINAEGRGREKTSHGGTEGRRSRRKRKRSTDYTD